MANKDIKAVRLKEWADPTAHLLLPPYIEQHKCRGVWFKLYDNGTITDISTIELNEKTDDNPAWDIYGL